MRWMILFKGAVETQEYFSVEMAKTFAEEGYQIYWYDLMLQQESARLLADFMKMHRKEQIVAFTFNFNGIAGEPGLYQEMERWNFWDAYQIPVFNMVVDHPLYYHKYEKTLPKRYWQFSIDRNHVRYLQRFCPKIRLAGTGTFSQEIQESGSRENEMRGEGFLPLGGTQLPYVKQNGCLPMDQRPINIIFTGNYTPLSQLDRYLNGMEQDYVDLYHELLQEAISHPERLIEDLAEERLKSELGPITDSQLKTCMPNLMYVDLCARFYYRGKAIQTLVDHGIKVDLYGAGWNLLECKHPENMVQHGNVNSQKCLDMIAQSKISLNVMPWFKDGAHDRIFNSMLNGAVVVSDDSIYLKEQFRNGKDICYYVLKEMEQIPAIVQELLDNPKKLVEIAESGYQCCEQKHTWAQRAADICRIIKKEIG